MADGWKQTTPRTLLIFFIQTILLFTISVYFGQTSTVDTTPCSELGASCLECNMNESCIYGQDTQTDCKVLDQCSCQGERSFTKIYNCRYCYQTPKQSYICTQKTHCKAISGNSPPPRYLTNCTVNEDILCLGNRTFNKYLPCNWTSGYRWSTTFLLSLTLGGFGVDRFYLGHWKEGLGKLFSFGGLGVWTLVDLVLVAIGYVGPADGSLYIF